MLTIHRTVNGNDLLKIFIYECLSLIIVCITLAIIFLPVLCQKINEFLMINVSLTYEAASYSFNTSLYILAGGVIFTFLMVLLGMLKIMKQKPLEAILDK